MSLEVRDLKTWFFTEDGIVKAVDGVSFNLKKGETLGLVGESGSGKSTVALSILRLVPSPGRIISGQILFDGIDLLKLDSSEMRRIRGGKIAIIFQDPTSFLNPTIPVGEQIAEAIRLHRKIPKVEAFYEAIQIMEKVGINDASIRARDYPHQLSGGMRQRVMIAMAISCNPSLLIADEPTTNLDVTVEAQILELLKNLKVEKKLSLLLITHNLGIVAEMCDKVAVMYAGKVVEYGDVYTIFESPSHPYTYALLESYPSIRYGVYLPKELKVIPGDIPDGIHLPPGCRFHPRCPFSKEICRLEAPKKIKIGNEHYVSCHFPIS